MNSTLLPLPEVNRVWHEQGLLMISGQPGSGKSQLALDLLAQLTSVGVRFVFFDMKGELEDDPNIPERRNTRTQFLKQPWRVTCG